MNVSDAGRAILSLIYPPACEKCGTGVAPSRYLCDTCLGSAERIEAPFCQVCSEPFRGSSITGEFVCANCAGRRIHFQYAVAKYRSAGVVREMIHRFKYFSELHLRHALADFAAEGLADERISRAPIDAFIPVPLFRSRRRERGFNQAAEIARLLARRAGVPVNDCLERTRHTESQITHDREGRMENLRNAFRLRHTTDVRGRSLVLIDDVLTTGSTLNECARVLLEAGAASVRAITVARG